MLRDSKMAPLCKHGRISLLCFIGGLSTVFIPLLLNCLHLIVHHSDYVTFACGILLVGIVYVYFTGDDFKVAIRAVLLGLAGSAALQWALRADPNWRHFALYVTALSFFHWSEYFTTAYTNPKNLSLDSYLLDHSREYHLAAILSCLEYTVELFLAPGMKGRLLPCCVGLAMVVGGELLRKAAMLTASTNFNHYIQRTRDTDHQLVTWGVYSVFRHPSYVGWFYWSIGTQVMLCNPLCVAGYAWASWHFFRARIEDEEMMLVTFFGKQYTDYQKNVGTGLPYITGYHVDL